MSIPHSNNGCSVCCPACPHQKELRGSRYTHSRRQNISATLLSHSSWILPSGEELADNWTVPSSGGGKKNQVRICTFPQSGMRFPPDQSPKNARWFSPKALKGSSVQGNFSCTTLQGHTYSGAQVTNETSSLPSSIYFFFGRPPDETESKKRSHRR